MDSGVRAIRVANSCLDPGMEALLSPAPADASGVFTDL